MPLYIYTIEPAEIAAALQTNNALQVDLTREHGQMEVSFPNLASLTVEQATALTTRHGMLSLPNLTELDEATASVLGTHRGLLKLPNLLLDNDTVVLKLVDGRVANGNQPVELSASNLDLAPETLPRLLPLVSAAWAASQDRFRGWLTPEVYSKLDPHLKEWDLRATMAVCPTTLMQIARANKLVAINYNLLNHGTDGENWAAIYCLPPTAHLTITDLTTITNNGNDDILEILLAIPCELTLPDLEQVPDDLLWALCRERNRATHIPRLQHVYKQLQRQKEAAAQATHEAWEYANQVALRNCFQSTDVSWTAFLKRFDTTQRRICWYPADGGMLADVIPLHLAQAADVFIFVDDQIWQDGGTIHAFPSLVQEGVQVTGTKPRPLQLYASHSDLRTRTGENPRAAYFQLHYRLQNDPIGERRLVDCIRVQAEWWSVFSAFVLRQGMRVNALVIDNFGYSLGVSLLVAKCVELQLGSALIKMDNHQTLGETLQQTIAHLPVLPENPAIGTYFANASAQAERAQMFCLLNLVPALQPGIGLWAR